MKACIIQPLYSTDYSRSDELFAWELDMLDKCDCSMDIIVLPESSDVPALAHTREDLIRSTEKYHPALLSKAIETAKRCDAVVFFNSSSEGYKNTTFAIDRSGNVVGKYDKVHPVYSEIFERGRDGGYTFEFDEPYVIEIDGLRYGFLTCYDFYFYEMYSNIARYNVDIIIGCSHQRSDTHEALETMTRFCAYNTNAHVLRASVSMGLDSTLGGSSMAVSPQGKVLHNMRSEVGAFTVEFDPHDKYYKPAGYGNPPSAHWQYAEIGRRPWKYRQGGSGIVAFDKWMSYPRICAHRGFNTIAPENTMPALGAAVSMGADEIEFDVWETKDGQLVVAHDHNLERVSNGTGYICDYTLDELKELDFSGGNTKLAGLRIPTFEEVLKQFSGRVIMNLHIKIWDVLDDPDSKQDPHYESIARLIKKYDCEQHVYFMSTNTKSLVEMRKLLPFASYCQGAGRGNAAMVNEAIANGFNKVQFVIWHPIDREMIDRAHAHGIKCNLCQADDLESALMYLDMGIDTVMTNDFHLIHHGIKHLLHKYM